MRIRSWCLLVGASLACLRCGMGKDVSETKKTSADIKTISKEIATGTTEIIQYGRKGQVNEALPKFWKELTEADTNVGRLHWATVLCSTFEFQQWTGNYGDTLDLKSRLEAQGMRAFVAFAKEKIGRNYEVGGIEWVGQRWLSLAAIGAMMSEIDISQADAAKANGVEPRSIYSMIIDGLGYKDASNRGEKIPEFAQEVLRGEDEMVYLLQLRHNFLPIMVLSEFSDIDRILMTPTNLLNVPRDAFKLVKEFGIGFTAKIGESNFEKVKGEGLHWFAQAFETQKDLRRLGYPIVTNRFLARIFVRANFETSGIANFSGNTLSQIQLFTFGVDALKRSYVENMPRYRVEKYIPQALRNW